MDPQLAPTYMELVADALREKPVNAHCLDTWDDLLLAAVRRMNTL